MQSEQDDDLSLTLCSNIGSDPAILEAKRTLASRHPERIVRIDYTNWRGERRWRKVLPIATFWCHDKDEWHGPGWRMAAFDFEKGDVREFPHASIHEWKESYDDADQDQHQAQEPPSEPPGFITGG